MTDDSSPYSDLPRKRRAQMIAAKAIEETLCREMTAYLSTPPEDRGTDLDGLILLVGIIAALRGPDGDSDRSPNDTVWRALDPEATHVMNVLAHALQASWQARDLN